MNSGLQSLSQLAQLRDFFISDKWRADINTDNVLGHKGQVADAYASLVRRVWSAQRYSNVSPSAFKRLVGSCNAQFAGHGQQDSQEFLGFLLDALHEDLNRVKKKPPTEAVEVDQYPDHAAAGEEAWCRHLLRNQSIITDCCQGMYRSTVVCSTCDNRVS